MVLFPSGHPGSPLTGEVPIDNPTVNTADFSLGLALGIKEKYKQLDAFWKFDIRLRSGRENPACICGEVLKGVKTPFDCKLFGKVCTPENPVGACMVSTEGACAIYYKYGDRV